MEGKALLDDAARRDLDTRAAAFAERAHVPGITYGIVADGAMIHAGGIGQIRAGAHETPTPDTATRIASMTKSFTAAALLLLRDEGVIRLDDPIAEHVPELTNLWPPTADSPEVTVRHLMTMSSGLPEDDAWADRLLDLRPDELSALLRSGATFAHPPGIAFEYANLGWAMLGRAIANVSGEPAQDVVSRRLLEPLGLGSTGWTRPDGSVMTGHRWQDDAWVEESPPLGDGGFAPMGGLWSTIADLARWVGWLLDAYPARSDPDEGPLSRASRREMQQVHRSWKREDPSDPGGYGYGLFVWNDSPLGTLVQHPGGLPGFGSHMRWMPDRGAGSIALGNVTYAPMRELTLELLEFLDELGAIPPRAPIVADELRAACDGLARLLGSWDDALADALFADNVFPDEERERRRTAMARMLDEIGSIGSHSIEPASATRATRATLRLTGSRGSASVEVMLSPEVPPRIEWYEIRVAPL